MLCERAELLIKEDRRQVERKSWLWRLIQESCHHSKACKEGRV